MPEQTESDVHFARGLHDGSTDEYKRLFADFRLRAYKARPQWKTDTFSEYFADYFAKFTPNDFKLLDADVRRELRDIPRDIGVYVPKGRGSITSDGFYAVVKGDLPWPVNEEDEETQKSIDQELENSLMEMKHLILRTTS